MQENNIPLKDMQRALLKMIDGIHIRVKPEKKEEYREHAGCLFSSWMYILALYPDGTAKICTKYHYIFDGSDLNDFEF